MDIDLEESKKEICDICTEASVHVHDGKNFCEPCYDRYNLAITGCTDEYLPDENHVSCEVCDNLAVSEYFGHNYCEDCYNTQVLHIGLYICNIIKKVPFLGLFIFILNLFFSTIEGVDFGAFKRYLKDIDLTSLKTLYRLLKLC